MFPITLSLFAIYSIESMTSPTTREKRKKGESDTDAERVLMHSNTVNCPVNS